VSLPEYPGAGKGEASLRHSGTEGRELLPAKRQLDGADRTARGALFEASDGLYAEPVRWAGHSQSRGSRSGHGTRSAPALRDGRFALPAVRDDGALPGG